MSREKCKRAYNWKTKTMGELHGHNKIKSVDIKENFAYNILIYFTENVEKHEGNRIYTFIFQFWCAAFV